MDWQYWIGRVTQTDEDGAGIERYFTVEYKRNIKSFSVEKCHHKVCAL